MKCTVFLKFQRTIYRLQGKPYDNYRISLQSVNITGFPYNIHNFSLWGVYGFSVILTALFHRYCREHLWEPCKSPVNICSVLYSTRRFLKKALFYMSTADDNKSQFWSLLYYVQGGSLVKSLPHRSEPHETSTLDIRKQIRTASNIE